MPPGWPWVTTSSWRHWFTTTGDRAFYCAGLHYVHIYIERDGGGLASASLDGASGVDYKSGAGSGTSGEAQWPLPPRAWRIIRRPRPRQHRPSPNKIKVILFSEVKCVVSVTPFVIKYAVDFTFCCLRRLCSVFMWPRCCRNSQVKLPLRVRLLSCASGVLRAHQAQTVLGERLRSVFSFIGCFNFTLRRISKHKYLLWIIPVRCSCLVDTCIHFIPLRLKIKKLLFLIYNLD